MTRNWYLEPRQQCQAQMYLGIVEHLKYRLVVTQVCNRYVIQLIKKTKAPKPEYTPLNQIESSMLTAKVVL